MANPGDVLRRIRTLVAASETRRRWSKVVLSASEKQLAETSALLATGISAIERCETRRAASRPSALANGFADGNTLDDVLPSLIQLREIRKRFMRDHDRASLVNEVLVTAMQATRT